MRFLVVSFFIIVNLFGFFDETKINILTVNQDTIVVDKGDLKIGQSGIVVHKFKNNNEIILSYAKIIKSNKNSSIAKLLDIKVLEQEALPNTNIKISTKDKFILNHLYQNSLIVAPNYTIYSYVKDNYDSFNFINIDFFAAYLKIEKIPTPKKDNFLNFCFKNQIGSIFVVAKQKLHILDCVTFNDVYSKDISLDYNNSKATLPFFSNIDEIKGGLFNFDEVEDYDKYWSNLIKGKDE